jgi:magnesium transporter
VSGHLIARGAVRRSFDRAEIEEHLASGDFFWLDIHQPSPDDFSLLRNVFEFHPLAVEDSEHFGQRAKVEDYDDFVFLVVYGAAPDEDSLVEVHCFYSERFLVTVRRDEAPAFDELRERCARGRLEHEPIMLLYQVVDELVDSFFPALADFDDRIDGLQNEMLAQPSQEQLHELYGMRRRLVTLRRAIAPERDLFGRIVAGAVSLPGLTTEAERRFRDVYDHLVRLGEVIDGYRDLLAASIDLYMSSASNRITVVMKQLAVIATIFLPLTFITGFFGQNFPWLVEHIGGATAFIALGVGIELAAVLVLLVYFRRRGWF